MDKDRAVYSWKWDGRLRRYYLERRVGSEKSYAYVGRDGSIPKYTHNEDSLQVAEVPLMYWNMVKRMHSTTQSKGGSE